MSESAHFLLIPGCKAVFGRLRAVRLFFRPVWPALADQNQSRTWRSTFMKVVQLVCAVALGLAAVSPAMASEEIIKKARCVACHAVDQKRVGPAYKDVAKKFAGQKDAVDMLAEKIMKGSQGVWGPVPMPANTQVSAAEAKELATWVMSLK